LNPVNAGICRIDSERKLVRAFVCINLNYAMEEEMMSRKMTSALVFILAVLLATVPAWSSAPGPINPADSGKNLTTDLNTTADTIFKTAIILARGGNGGGGGGGGGNGGGNGGQGGDGNGNNGGQGGNGDGNGNNGGQGGDGDGDCDGEGPNGPNGGAGPGRK